MPCRDSYFLHKVGRRQAGPAGRRALSLPAGPAAVGGRLVGSHCGARGPRGFIGVASERFLRSELDGGPELRLGWETDDAEPRSAGGRGAQ